MLFKDHFGIPQKCDVEALHSVQDTGSGLYICDKSLPRAAKQFVSVIRGLKKQFLPVLLREEGFSSP